MLEVAGILGNTIGDADRSSIGLAEDFNSFLALLTTQLQFQDPLDPMDSSEFTNQLVQFTNVEQNIRANKNLENIAALTAFNGINSAVGFLGKDITVQQSDAKLQDGQARWVYELTGSSTQTVLSVRDSLGNTVYQQEGFTEVGSHGFTWNGLDAQGQPLPDDTYTLVVKATDSNEAAVATNIFTRATVEAVDLSSGEAFLEAGGFQIPLANVIAVQPKEAPAPAP
jgi:flagellar basal-body rod modification protein FlgD